MENDLSKVLSWLLLMMGTDTPVSQKAARNFKCRANLIYGVQQRVSCERKG